MRRRDLVAEAARTAEAKLPENLLHWDGQFIDPTEPVPTWWRHGPQAWRNTGGWGRWLAARRAWCKERGLDYSATFRRCSLERAYEMADERARR